MLRQVHPLLLAAALLVAVFLLAGIGPRERSLGVNVRLVHLHGAWVWTALLGFGAAALAGLVGLILRHAGWQNAPRSPLDRPQRSSGSPARR